jgi:hypothetical protein
VNILTETLPTAVEVDGVAYKINTDFRNAIRVMLAFEDDELTFNEKQMILLGNLYPEVPENVQGALEQGGKFLSGGKTDEPTDEPLRLYSFSKDADLIFAAFQQTHRIDLETAKLHWWKFLALFSDLGGDTTFCQLVGLRKRLKTGKATKEEREEARDMEDIIEIPEPDDRTLEEKEKERIFMQSIGKVK